MAVRQWTEIEKLLDAVFHDASLASNEDWRMRASEALCGCPRSRPEGTCTPLEVSREQDDRG
jgi:hypothetical protein